MNALEDLYRMRAEKEAKRNGDIGLAVEALNRYQERNRVYASQTAQELTQSNNVATEAINTAKNKIVEKRTKRLSRFDDGYALGFVIGLLLSCMTIAFLWWLL